MSATPLVTSPPQNPTPRHFKGLRSIAAIGLSWILSLWLTAAPALALNDGQQLVVESWRLVNQSYVDPDRFETIHWKRLRQKALERSIQSSADAYDAIEAMLAPIGDPYTRLLRPADFVSLKANTEGSVSGVGLQLGIRQDDTAIVVIAPSRGRPPQKRASAAPACSAKSTASAPPSSAWKPRPHGCGAKKERQFCCS